MSIVDQLAPRIVQHAVDLVRLAADITVADTKADASRATGALADSISHDEPQASVPLISCRITATAPYARWQDEGTGIYGPSGQRIFPTHAKALRFDWPAAGGVVFAKSVAGSPGKHYFTEPMPARWANALQSAAA